MADSTGPFRDSTQRSSPSSTTRMIYSRGCSHEMSYLDAVVGWVQMRGRLSGRPCLRRAQVGALTSYIGHTILVSRRWNSRKIRIMESYEHRHTLSYYKMTTYPTYCSLSSRVGRPKQNRRCNNLDQGLRIWTGRGVFGSLTRELTQMNTPAKVYDVSYRKYILRKHTHPAEARKASGCVC